MKLDPLAVDDTVAYPRMIALLACLEQEIAARHLPGFCFIGLVPGGEAAFDHCGDCDDDSGCGGMAWVLETTEYASTSRPPSPDVTSSGCGSQMLTQLQLGIQRCMPAGGDDGTPPTADELHATTRLQMADKAAMRAAILCCFAKDDALSVQLGTYTPSIPSGGCVGGTWTVNVW